jgi:uncharacterized protein
MAGSGRGPRGRGSVRRAALLAILAVWTLACGAEAQPGGGTGSSGGGTSAGGGTAQAGTPAAGGQAGQAQASDQGVCTAAAANRPRPTGRLRMTIATGGTGGVFFPYGGGLARILSSKLPNSEFNAEVTGGSVDNMKLVASDDAASYIGMSTVDSAYEGYQGEGVYKDVGKIPACTLATLYQSYIHIVALDGTGITRVQDFKGKRVSVGSAGSSTEVAADRILEAAGLNPRSDVTRDNLSVAESVAAMKDRKIDAFFWIGGLPTAAVTDLVNTPNLRVRFIPGDSYLQAMRQKYGPVYAPFALPRGTYAGVEGEVPGIGVGNILFTRNSMNEGLAYDLVKAIFDNLNEVKAIHPEAQTLSVETAATNSSIPFHPGAVRFYREKGAWKG